MTNSSSVPQNSTDSSSQAWRGSLSLSPSVRSGIDSGLDQSSPRVLLDDSSTNTHAVTFHHFHNEFHPIGQGSLSAEQFSEVMDWLGERYTILSAQEYLFKLKQQSLKPNDICLTFDDALLCQADIAAPILKKRNIQAFFFIYSSPFFGNPDYLEIYRYFRMTEFASVDDFYEEFFRQFRELFSDQYSLAERDPRRLTYLQEYLFYTPNDRWFRFLRDIILGKERYMEIMRLMMASAGFDPKTIMKKLWMRDQTLKDLALYGHAIGLHSYTHPTTLHLLNKADQAREYQNNYLHLRDVLNQDPIAMSHPCGNYNSDTLEILDSKGIQIGFRSNNSIREIRSHLEVPRDDHANVLKRMNLILDHQ